MFSCKCGMGEGVNTAFQKRKVRGGGGCIWGDIKIQLVGTTTVGSLFLKVAI